MNSKITRTLALIAFTTCLGVSFAAENHLKNPGFESKEAWTTPKGHVTFKPDGAVQARSGSGVGFVGGWAGGSGQFISQSTELTIESGKKYNLSAWFAPRKDNDNSTKFGGTMLRIIAAGDKGRFCVALQRSQQDADDWTQKKLTWIAPADLTQAREIHALTGEPTGKTVDITNSTVEVLVGKYIGYGDAYYQTYIDDAKLYVGDEEPEDEKKE